MKTTITPNGVVIRFKNRRIIMWLEHDGSICMESQRPLFKGEDPKHKTAGTKMVNRFVKATFHRHSPEGAYAMAHGFAIMILFAFVKKEYDAMEGEKLPWKDHLEKVHASGLFDGYLQWVERDAEYIFEKKDDGNGA